MNRTELIEALAGRLEKSRAEATETLDAVLDEIKKAVASGDKVSLSGFGVFENIARNARKARNPQTGESVAISATKVPKFRAGADFKALVSGAKKAVAGRAQALPTGKKKKSTAKAKPAKKSTAKKSTAKKSTAKKSTAKKSTAKKSTAKKSTAKKSTAKKSTAKKSTAKK